MKNNLQRQIKRYIKEISLLIPNNYPNKKIIINAIKQNLDDFTSEHPDSSFEDMIKEFGNTSEIADSFMEELSGMDIAFYLQKKESHNRFILFTCILTAVLILLALLGCVYYWGYPLKVSMGDTYYYYNGTEIDYEEFMEMQTE